MSVSIPTRMNPDLAKERASCPFDKEEITNLIDGSKEKTESRRSLQSRLVAVDGLVDTKTVVESLGTSERYEYDLRKTAQLFQLTRRFSGGTPSVDHLKQMMTGGASDVPLPDGHPMSLHFGMFMPAIMSLANTEQQAKWMGRAWNMEIVGTYAQTELGHGTFLRGLETTATYDPSTKEFILHTPTLSAYKWWPGSLGKTANYGIVMAQLVTQGQKRGPHAFMVQLRDEETHKTLPGLKIGVIGEKLGMHSADNGFLAFNRHRIPLDNMLMRNSQVLPDGTYVKPQKAQLNYSTMVFVRCNIAEAVTTRLQKATTIAVRYSAVRRQSELLPGKREPQIIEYQTQQEKLFPALAMCFGFNFAAEKVWQDYETNTELLEKGDLSLLPKLHALSSGLKALSSQECTDQVDILRRACGGHGYLLSSNLPRLWQLNTAARTYEGENTVLMLQVARYLSKEHSAVGFPGERAGHQPIPYNTGIGHQRLFHQVAQSLIATAMEKVNRDIAKKMHPSLAWNAHTVDLAEAADAFIRAYVIAEFERRINEGVMSAPVKRIVGDLCELLGIVWLLQKKGDFLLHTGIRAQDLVQMENRRDAIFAAIRPNAVNIVDAFDFRDEVLRSTLGSYDGNVYERLFQAAQKNPLNKVDAHPGIQKYIKPLLKAKL